MFRIFTSDPIGSEVSQSTAAMSPCAVPGVKKAAEEETSEQEGNENPISSQGCFEADIEALEQAYGPLSPGKTINVDLQTLLSICYRKRRRSDAYSQLIKYLDKQMCVRLNIGKKKGNTDGLEQSETNKR